MRHIQLKIMSASLRQSLNHSLFFRMFIQLREFKSSNVTNVYKTKNIPEKSHKGQLLLRNYLPIQI